MSRGEEERVPEVLLMFLDAATPAAKLDVIFRHREEIDERMLSNMEASLDICSADSSKDARLDYLEYYLRTRGRFETSRLR